MKKHQITLTEQGHENIEALFEQAGLLPPGSPLYDPKHISLMHHVNAALRALHLYHKDRHYVVQDNQAVIVDEFTGRLMPGRRWGDGLHQAIEAKEGLHINPESLTLASITFQNYFRLFEKLAGMTGTADTEAYEFQEIYRLETVIIPPNKTSQRQDDNDRVYQSTPEKFRAAIDDIRECHQRQQPVLVGTSSIENSEHISRLLTRPSCRIRCSTPNSTLAKPKSLPRRVLPVPSPSPPTWQAEARTSCWAATLRNRLN